MSKPGEKVHNKVVFKEYNQKQLSLPMDLESLIPPEHMVRVINDAIDRLDLSPLFARYPGGGRSSFHPVMMTKLIIYAYTDRIYSSRRMEKAARENIMYMWLLGGNAPDFKTINSFRGERMKEVIPEIFSEVVELLHREGYIKLENYFLDGTKIEANANKYSWVWGKSTKRYKENLRKKCLELIHYGEQINEEEERIYGERNLEELGDGHEINSAALEEAVRRIDERLAGAPKDKDLKKAKRILEKDYLPRMRSYEEQEEILAERGSYSKTDKDATFMRMKEDHMRNGQLKPGYNVQIGTENQFVVGCSLHQKATDTSCLKEHLEGLKQELGGRLPKNIVADAGYGSEENYEYLEQEGLGHYVKYNTYDRENSKGWKTDATRVKNWAYDPEKDEYLCGYGRSLKFLHERNEMSKNGYKSRVRIYGSEDCGDCPYRTKCIRQADGSELNKRIYISRRREELKAIARENLESDYGVKMRSLRPVEVENVFGNIKGNLGIRRFMLKGLSKVSLEWRLYCIAHNLRKMAASLT